MANYKDINLQEIIEYKESTEQQKEQKKALKAAIRAILTTLVLGGVGMYVSRQEEPVKNEQTTESDDEIKKVTLDKLPGVSIMPEVDSNDHVKEENQDISKVTEALYLQFNPSFIEPDFIQDVMVLKNKDNNAYKLTVLPDQKEDGWEYLGILNNKLSEEIYNNNFNIYAVTEPENSHLTETHTALICNSETSKNSKLYEGYVLNYLGTIKDFVDTKKDKDKEAAYLNNNSDAPNQVRYDEGDKSLMQYSDIEEETKSMK